MIRTTSTRMTWLRVGYKLPPSSCAVQPRSASTAPRPAGGSAPATLPTDPAAQVALQGMAPDSNPKGCNSYRAHPSYGPYLSFRSWFFFLAFRVLGIKSLYLRVNSQAVTANQRGFAVNVNCYNPLSMTSCQLTCNS